METSEGNHCPNILYALGHLGQYSYHMEYGGFYPRERKRGVATPVKN